MRCASRALLLGSLVLWLGVEGASLLSSIIQFTPCSSLTEPSIAVLEQTLQSGSVIRGESVTLLCSVTVSPQTAIVWYKDGQRLTGDEDTRVRELSPNKQIGVATVESRLFIPCFSEVNVGKYTCDVDTGCGATQTSSAILTLDYSQPELRCKSTTYPPVITQATLTRIELLQNPVHLMCRASGSPKPRIEWTRIDDDGRDISIENDVRFQKQSSGDLIVFGQMNSEVAQMSLRCTARNAFGEASNEAVIIYTNDN